MSFRCASGHSSPARTRPVTLHEYRAVQYPQRTVNGVVVDFGGKGVESSRSQVLCAECALKEIRRRVSPSRVSAGARLAPRPLFSR